MMEKYDIVALPVVDELGRLQGRITIDDVVDVIREEAEKDYALASGISGDVDSSDNVLTLTRARLPWLLIGLLGGILGARVIELYEGDLQLYPEMAFFIPLIAAMGGNAGVQSSAIIVQGLATKSMGMSGILPKLGKEFMVGLLNGLVCAVIIFGYNMIFGDSLALSYTVSIALLSVIIIATLFGTFVPLILDKYDIDPALATGPFITTVNDVLGLFIYFIIGHLLYIA
jgi:magnesium transporter